MRILAIPVPFRFRFAISILISAIYDLAPFYSALITLAALINPALAEFRWVLTSYRALGIGTIHSVGPHKSRSN